MEGMQPQTPQFGRASIVPVTQMQTPEPSPFKRPAMTFHTSPLLEPDAHFPEMRQADRKSHVPGMLSPPPSPYIGREISNVPSDLGASAINRDPVLYDTPPTDEIHRPLFEATESRKIVRTASTDSPLPITHHIPQNLDAIRDLNHKQRQVLPKFRSTAWQGCFANCSDYFRKEKQILLEQRHLRRNMESTTVLFDGAAAKTVAASLKKSHHRSRSLGSVSELSGHRKDKPRLQRTMESKIVKPKFSRQSRPVTTTRKDIHYSTVEDVTPSLDSLPNNPRCLHVDWSGAPLDISNDPDKHRLHPAEQHLASTLKLTCGQYLTQKRLIFLERVTRLRAGNQVFSRTHAQQVCHIDVNKASRLFAAFEKVGWLSPQTLCQYF